MLKTMTGLAVAFLLAVSAASTATRADEAATLVTITHIDGRAATVGLDPVNRVLAPIGVHLGTVAIPASVVPLLRISETRALSEEEGRRVMAAFALHRGQLLEEIAKAGRRPEAHRGGALTTSDVGDTPYPKLFDMKAIPEDFRPIAKAKYGKFHVNTSDEGVGLDELMTVVSGGPWVWFFRLADGELVKLTVGPLRPDGKAIRVSYAGLVPHAAFIAAPHGLTVAHAIGPKTFRMRYDDPSVAGAEILGTNPWIDFSGPVPTVKD